MDAAAAARMSDPENNPNFKRRWRDDLSGADRHGREIKVQDVVEECGLRLLMLWRQEQALARRDGGR